MKYYSLKSHSQNLDYMEVLSENESGYCIKIIRDKDGYEEITTDFLTKELFESCLRTGYISEIEDTSVCVAAC
ncbi:MAG: hypothetical protein ACTTHG_00380 [Treponemataceae bacterium]